LLFILFVSFFVSACATMSSRAVIPSSVYTEALRIEDFIPQWQELNEGLYLTAGKIKNPRIEFWAIRVDLTAENIEIIVNEPDSDENRKTGKLSAITVSGFAAKYGCAAAMNAGPFSPVSDKTGEERTLTGIFISSGRMVSAADPRYDSLLLYNEGRAAIVSQADPSVFDSVRHALGGFYSILSSGDLTASVVDTKIRHPRSAAAIADNGRVLYLLVIDGRRLGSIGATGRETGLLLRALGAEYGILMDGGGSSALALDFGSGGKILPVNRPVHGRIIGRERAVATCIGVRVRPMNAKH
jgi:exopolysaccharide biosynthesis protein